jgi:glutamate 5-kinase
VGQCELIYTYDRSSAHTTTQWGSAAGGGGHPQRHPLRNLRNTNTRLLELKALPIINENDAVATDEIGVENTIGENYTLPPGAKLIGRICWCCCRTSTGCIPPTPTRTAPRS